MSTRYRANFLYGTLSGFNTSQTTFTGTGFPASIPNNQYLAITLNPGYYGATTSSEVVYVTSITGNVITVSGRGAESTAPISGSNGTVWVAGPLASDFDASNLSSSGALTLNNGLTVASGNVVVPSGSIAASGIKPGTNGQILTTSGGVTTWANPAAVTLSGIPIGTLNATGGTYSAAETFALWNNSSLFLNGGMTVGTTPGTGSFLSVPVAGYYHINLSVMFTSASAGTYKAVIRADGVDQNVTVQTISSTASFLTLTVNCIAYVGAGIYGGIYNTVSSTVSSDSKSTFLTATLVSQ